MVLGDVWRHRHAAITWALPAAQCQHWPGADIGTVQKNEFPKGKKSTAPVVQEALRETIISMHEGNLESQQLTSMLSIQQQRDRYMARQLLSAPVPSLLIAGGYHASKSMGVPLHMEDLATGTHPVVLMLAEKGMNITVDHADYVWFVAPDTTKR